MRMWQGKLSSLLSNFFRFCGFKAWLTGVPYGERNCVA